MNREDKKQMLWMIKYGPTILAVILSTKILVASIGAMDIPWEWKTISYLNSLLTIGITKMFMISGRTLGYCWKYQSLCKISLWGVAFYLALLTFPPPMGIALGISIFYIILVICMEIIYYFLDF